MAIFNIPITSAINNDRRRFSLTVAEPPIDTSLDVMLNLSVAAVSALLVGVIKSRSSYLMPFFGIQLYNFFLVLPKTFHPPFYAHISGYTLNGQNVRPPHKDEFPSMPNNDSLIFGASSEFLQLLFRIYFICAVWKCYRYLKLKKLMMPLRRSNYLHDIDVSVLLIGVYVYLYVYTRVVGQEFLE